jgi:hypothetical protein
MLNGVLDVSGPAAPGGKWAEFSGRLWLRGAGAAYSSGVKPECDAILQAAGLSSTLDATGAAEKYTYDSLATGLKTVTVYLYHYIETGVWVKHIITAARASRVVLRFKNGQPGECEFTLRGRYIAPTDASVITPTYQTTVAPNWATASGTAAFMVGSFATGVASECTVTIENSLAARGSANAIDGLAGYLPSQRKITVAATIEGVRIADYNQFLKWSTPTAEALALRLPGGTGTQYNRLTLDGDKLAAVEAPSYGENSGLVNVALSGLLSPEGANRCRIVFN